MPKKKPDKELKLQFTGKMSILVELEDHGPIQWRINDKDTTMEVVRVLLNMNNITSVDGYDKREQKTFEKILDGIE
jgi:hypothetical protein